MLINKLIRAGDNRLSRLHTEENELIPLGQAVFDVPAVTCSKISALIRRRRPIRPWWPVRVIPIIEEFIRPDQDVIEFGSGSSTIWLAQRARTVCSMEENEEWAQRTKSRLSEHGLDNATVHHATAEKYWVGPPGAAKFDLAIIDGGWRWKCVDHILPRMKPGGIVYLDNADSDKDLCLYEKIGSSRLAQQVMQNYVREVPGASLSKIASMVDGELYAGAGWILKTPMNESYQKDRSCEDL